MMNYKSQSIFVLFICLIVTSCKQPYPDIGKGYFLDKNSMSDLAIVNEQNTYLIYGHIVDYAFDKDFVLVAERPRSNITECNGKPSGTLKECDAALEKSTYVRYWIIDKRASAEEKAKKAEAARPADADYQLPTNIHGPYTKQEYLSERKALHVPDSLALLKY